MSGAWCIAGTRITVEAIQSMRETLTPDGILKLYPHLTREQIDAALTFKLPRPAKAVQSQENSSDEQTSEPPRACVYCGNPYGNGHSNRCAVTRLGWVESWSPLETDPMAGKRFDGRDDPADERKTFDGREAPSWTHAEPVQDTVAAVLRLEENARDGARRAALEACARIAHDARHEGRGPADSPSAPAYADGYRNASLYIESCIRALIPKTTPAQRAETPEPNDARWMPLFEAASEAVRAWSRDRENRCSDDVTLAMADLADELKKAGMPEKGGETR